MVGEKSRLSEKWEKQVVIGYGATSFSAGLLQNLFLCYYLPLFLLEHKLSDGWFYAGEVLVFFFFFTFFMNDFLYFFFKKKIKEMLFFFSQTKQNSIRIIRRTFFKKIKK